MHSALARSLQRSSRDYMFGLQLPRNRASPRCYLLTSKVPMLGYDTVLRPRVLDLELLHSLDSFVQRILRKVHTMHLDLSHICCALLAPTLVLGKIDRCVQYLLFCTSVLTKPPCREKVVSQFNIVRTSLINNETTPLQVGNGNFAFNVDNTGLQVRLDAGRCLTGS